MIEGLLKAFQAEGDLASFSVQVARGGVKSIPDRRQLSGKPLAGSAQQQRPFSRILWVDFREDESALGQRAADLAHGNMRYPQRIRNFANGSRLVQNELVHDAEPSLFKIQLQSLVQAVCLAIDSVGEPPEPRAKRRASLAAHVVARDVPFC